MEADEDGLKTRSFTPSPSTIFRIKKNRGKEKKNTQRTFSTKGGGKIHLVLLKIPVFHTEGPTKHLFKRDAANTGLKMLLLEVFTFKMKDLRIKLDLSVSSQCHRSSSDH